MLHNQERWDPIGGYDDVAELTRRRQAMQARRKPAGRAVLLNVALLALYLALVVLAVVVADLAGAL